jgi:hypothetical protein
MLPLMRRAVKLKVIKCLCVHPTIRVPLFDKQWETAYASYLAAARTLTVVVPRHLRCWVAVVVRILGLLIKRLALVVPVGVHQRHTGQQGLPQASPGVPFWLVCSGALQQQYECSVAGSGNSSESIVTVRRKHCLWTNRLQCNGHIGGTSGAHGTARAPTIDRRWGPHVLHFGRSAVVEQQEQHNLQKTSTRWRRQAPWLPLPHEPIETHCTALKRISGGTCQWSSCHTNQIWQLEHWQVLSGFIQNLGSGFAGRPEGGKRLPAEACSTRQSYCQRHALL